MPAPASPSLKQVMNKRRLRLRLWVLTSVLLGILGAGGVAVILGSAADPVPYEESRPLAASPEYVQSRRLHPGSDLVYLGAFRVPQAEINGTTWAYGGDGMAYHAEGDAEGPIDGYPGSLLSLGYHATKAQYYATEITIPPPVISPDRTFADLPTAETLQPFVDVTEGRQLGGFEGYVLRDLQPLPAQGAQSAGKLYWVMWEYYLPERDLLTFGWSELDFNDFQSQGLWGLDNFPAAATSDYLFTIPSAWADDYTPGKLLAGGRFRTQNDGSFGPALYAFGPWNDGDPPVHGAQLDAVELLYYPEGKAMVRDFAPADWWPDGAWLSLGDKQAVIFAGGKAMRTYTDGSYYGPPDVDGCGYKGTHGEPYFGAMLFYDPYLLGQVANGRLAPDAVQPYAILNAEKHLFREGCSRYYLAGVGYDDERQRLYVVEQNVDGDSGSFPVIHVWQLVDGGQALDTTAPTSPTELRVTENETTHVTLRWTPATDENLVGYIIYRNNDLIATTRLPTYEDDKVNPGGSYTYAVVAWDALDQRSVPATLFVTTPDGTDDRPPIVADSGVRDITAHSAVVFWTTDEPATSLVRYGIRYQEPIEHTLIDGTLKRKHALTLTGLTPNKQYELYMLSTDSDGNTYDSLAQRTFFTTPPEGQPGGQAPHLQGVGAQRVYEGETLVLTLTADDGDSPVLTYTASTLPPDATFDPMTQRFSWTPDYTRAGTYYPTFGVNDGVFSASEEVIVYVHEAMTMLTATATFTTVDLTWAVNARLPSSVTWSLAAVGTDALIERTITALPGATRAYTFDGCMRHPVYTITLRAQLGATVIMSDTETVRVRRHPLYLPLMLRI